MGCLGAPEAWGPWARAERANWIRRPCIHCSYLVPSVHIDGFVINSEVHNYNTRKSQNLHLFNTRTSYGQTCI